MAYATPGEVLGVAKIGLGSGGLDATAPELGEFGRSLAALGDLDGDGTDDIAVGAPAARLGTTRSGAVHILFLRPDGSVKSRRAIASGTGGFSGAIDSDDRFGSAVAALGDLDGDGVIELAVGANGDDKRGVDSGAVWILFLRPDGSVKSQHKIATTGFMAAERAYDLFGSSIAAIGDFDGNGTPDLAVGSPGSGAGQVFRPGAVDLIFLEPDGHVLGRNRIEPYQGAGSGGRFGEALTSTDLDKDGIVDLIVGNPGVFQDFYESTPAVVFVLLTADGQPKRNEIAEWGGMTEPRPDGSSDDFAAGLAILGDVDGDGVEDLALGAPSRLSAATGKAMLLYLSYCGTFSDGEKERSAVKALERLDIPLLEAGDALGASFAPLGDLDGDGGLELAVGAPGDDGGGTNAGAIYILSLNGCGDDRVAGSESCDLGLMNGQPTSCCTASCELAEGHAACAQLVSGAVEITSRTGGLEIDLVRDERFGSAIVEIGDQDGDGVSEIAVGAPGGANCDDYDCGDGSDATGGGSIIILYPNPDGSVKAHSRIRPGEAGFDAPVETFDLFGSALATLGDVNGDGYGDLAVAALGDDDGQTDGTVCDVYRGAVWILFLGPNATVRSYVKLSSTSPASNGLLSDDIYWLGWSLASPGDLDGDGVPDLVVGDRFAYIESHRQGAVQLLLLNRDGTLREIRTIPNPELLSEDQGDQRLLFGSSVTHLGDLNGDGVGDLAVGAPSDDPIRGPYGYGDRGAVWILFLDNDAGLVRATKIDATPGTLPGINRNDCGDTDGDGATTVRDAQYALLIASVPLSCNPVICGACHLTGCCAPDTCDTNADYLVTATDALAVLHAAVGLAASLDCPVTPTLSLDDRFGVAVAALAPNLLAVGAEEVNATLLAKDTLQSPSCGHRSAVWLLDLRDDGTVEAATRISQGGEGFGATLNGGNEFAASLARISDMNGDGEPELAVGASRDYDRLLDLCNDPSNPRYAPPHYGATWILRLDAGRVVASRDASTAELTVR